MITHFRRPGGAADDWNESVDWPDALRVPVAGEMVELPVHGQVEVESVQWFLGEESSADNGGQPVVQLIVR